MRRNACLMALMLCFALVLSNCTAAPTPAAPDPSPLPQEPTLPAEPTSAPPTAAPTPAAAEPEAEPAVEDPIVLTLVGPEKELTFTMEELKDLPATSGQAGMLSSTGKITVPSLYTGVLLTDLVDLLGGLPPDYGLNVVAADGYAMTMSYDQVMNGKFVAYDPSDGSEKQLDDPLRAMVAYEVNGEPLDSRSDGDLRMVIISERNNQITDGHWSIKWVERIELMPLVKDWSLSLDGAREEAIDRNTFQSCAAVSCHYETWTDDQGQVWSGVPLYLLAGRVDDEITHEGPAYNRDLVKAGYTIELVASDGYTATIDSSAVYYNRDILVADLVNDAPLPDQYFPLRLVGEGLEKGQRVGSLAEIRLLLEEAGVAAVEEESPEPEGEAVSEEPPAGAELWITGLVVNPLALNDAALQAMGAVEATVEHPKRGPETYTGIYLNMLLGLASPQPGATELVLTASDGYNSSIDLAAVQACADCLLAFTEEAGVYNLAMPGFETSAWTKDLVKIEVK